MVRRVGFSDTQRDRPIARPATLEKTPPADMPSDDVARARALRFGPPRIKALYAGQKKPVFWLIIGFMCFWLVGWTLGILFAIGALLGGTSGDSGGDIFLLFWLVGASIGWIFAVWVLYWLFRGVRAAGKKPYPRGSHSD